MDFRILLMEILRKRGEVPANYRVARERGDDSRIPVEVGRRSVRCTSGDSNPVLRYSGVRCEDIGGSF